MSAVSRLWDGCALDSESAWDAFVNAPSFVSSAAAGLVRQHRGVRYSSDLRKTNATGSGAKKATPVRRRNRATDTEDEAGHPSQPETHENRKTHPSIAKAACFPR